MSPSKEASAADGDWTKRHTVPIPQAADILGISRGCAYAAARAGDLPTLKFGKRMVVATAVLRRMLDGQQPQRRAEGA